MQQTNYKYTRFSVSLSPLIGIHSIVVALLAEKADVLYDPDEISPEAIVHEIEGLGYSASVMEDFGVNAGKVVLIVCVHKYNAFVHISKLIASPKLQVQLVPLSI